MHENLNVNSLKIFLNLVRERKSGLFNEINTKQFVSKETTDTETEGLTTSILKFQNSILKFSGQ